MGDMTHYSPDEGYVGASIDPEEGAFDAGAYSFFGDMAPLDEGLGGALEDGLEAPPEELPAQEGVLEDEDDLPIEDLMDDGADEDEEDLSLAALLRRRMQEADEHGNGVSSKQAATAQQQQQHEQPMLPPMPPQPQMLSSLSMLHTPSTQTNQQQQHQQAQVQVQQPLPREDHHSLAPPQLPNAAVFDAVVPAPGSRPTPSKPTPSNVMTAEELEARMLRSAEAPPAASNNRGSQLLSMLKGGSADQQQQQRHASPMHAHDPAAAAQQQMQQMQLGGTSMPLGPPQHAAGLPLLPPGAHGPPPHMLQPPQGPGMMMPPHPGGPMPPPEALAHFQQQQQQQRPPLLPGQQPPYMGPQPPYQPGGPMPPPHMPGGPGMMGPGGPMPPPFPGMGMGPQQQQQQPLMPMQPPPGHHPGGPPPMGPPGPYGPGGGYGPRGPPPMGPGAMDMQQQQRPGMRPGQEMMQGPGQPPLPGQLMMPPGPGQPFPNGPPQQQQHQQQHQQQPGFKQQGLPPPGFPGLPAAMQQQRHGSPGGGMAPPHHLQQQQQQHEPAGGQQLPPWAGPSPAGPPRPQMPQQQLPPNAQQQQQQQQQGGNAVFGSEYMAAATTASADAMRVVSPAALVHKLRTQGSTWMAADDINYILRIQHMSTHSGLPYMEDFYFQAFCNKYFGGRNAVIFAPQQLRELSSDLEVEPRFADLSGLGRVVLSNIRTPKMLMDVGGGSNSKGKADAAAQDQQQQGEQQQDSSKARPLEQEPMLAARIMVEDCMLLLCDVEDIDRMFAATAAVAAAQAAGMPFNPHAPGPISAPFAQSLLQRRSALLGGIAASFRLPDAPTLPANAGDNAAAAGLSGDRVFVRILALPKGRSLITKTLKLMFSTPTASSSGSKGGPDGSKSAAAAAAGTNGSDGGAAAGAAMGLDVIWALLRNAHLAFGPPLVGSTVGEAEKRLTDSTIALSGITSEMVKRLKSPEDAVACLAAAVAGLSAAPSGPGHDHTAAAAANGTSAGTCQLLPLYPAGRVSASASPEWLASVLASLLLRATELGLGSFAAAAAAAPVRGLGDGAPDEAEVLAQQAESDGVSAAVAGQWQALLGQLVHLVQLHLWQLVLAVRGSAAEVAASAAAGPGSTEVLQASIVKMACVPFMRVLMAHCNTEQQEQLRSYLSEVGR